MPICDGRVGCFPPALRHLEVRRALQEVEEKQHRRELEMANATFDPAHRETLEIAMPESSDAGVRLRRFLSTLGVIRAQVAEACFARSAACPRNRE